MTTASGSGRRGSLEAGSARVIPQFVYLSCVLQQYGSNRRVPVDAAKDSATEKTAANMTFGTFLAQRIELGSVLLFDVHSLKLVTDDELDDVIQYLVHYTADSKHPLNVGIAAGLDYCVDAHRLSEEIQRTGSLPLLGYTPAIGNPKRLSRRPPITPALSAYESNDPSAWEEPKVPITSEFMAVQLANGRHQAATARTQPAKVLANPKKSMSPPARDRTAYRGAVKAKDWSLTWGDTRSYLAGKFNIAGYPALLLEYNIQSSEPVKTIGVRKHPEGSRLALRAQGWLKRLREMYLAEPHGKSHRQLCRLLADEINLASPLSSKTKTDERTIAREVTAAETYAGNPPQKIRRRNSK